MDMETLTYIFPILTKWCIVMCVISFAIGTVMGFIIPMACELGEYISRRLFHKKPVDDLE